jgi:hypothetical protein
VFPEYRRIQITSDINTSYLENAGGVGAGFSCGIDLFYTVMEHTDESCPPDFKLTHLAFFNVGAHGDFGGDRARDLFQKRIEEVRPCANELRLALVTLDSNISEILDMDFLTTHTYRNVAAVLALQKLFKTYYYSSTYPLRPFELNQSDSSHYDAYTLPLLSTGITKFFTSGENSDRLEKTDIVSSFPLSYKYLNVCVGPAVSNAQREQEKDALREDSTSEANCSRCAKCLRTMATLDVLGKLDFYDKAFDLNVYQKLRSRYFGLVLGERKRDPFKKIYDAIKQHDFHVPLGAHFFRYPPAIFPFAKKYCPKLIKAQYKKLRSGPHWWW